MAAQRLASSSHSNIGKSTTHSGRQPGVDQLEILADLQAQRSERIAHHLGGIGAEEDQIAVVAPPCVRMIPAMAASLKNFKIGDCSPSRPLATSFTLMYARPLGAEARHVRRVVVDLLARQLAALRHAQRRHAAARIRRRARRTP